MHSALFLLTLTLTPFVSAHCKITNAVGNFGGNGTGLGITAGSGNSESDVTIFFKTETAAGFGRTTKGGTVSAAAAVPAAMEIAGKTLPQVAQGGTVKMTLHQVNGDGAGPMTCAVSTDATGNAWTNMQVTQQVPGTNGRSQANNEDFPLTAQLPANATCTGTVAGQSGVCMVKCQNPVGPFGGTVAVQMACAMGNSSATAAGTAGAGGRSSTSTGATGTVSAGTTASTGSVTASNSGGTTKAADDDKTGEVDCALSTRENASKKPAWAGNPAGVARWMRRISGEIV